MLDTKSDYALNKVDKTAIVCPSVTGEHIRLTREDFSTEEEFERWKNWSDDDYHKIELAGRKEDDCLSFEAQRDVPTPSAEELFFAPYITAEQTELRQSLLAGFKTHLTEKQYRRMCLYYLEGKDEMEIAALEGVSQSSVSRSISSGAKNVERFLKKFLRGTA